VKKSKRIVLACSGSAATLAAIAGLRDEHDADVIALTLDLGQGRELDRIREHALSAGAVRAHVIDARDEFAVQYVLPALQAGALAQQDDPLSAALARPLVARKLVEICALEQAALAAHGGRRGAELRLSRLVHSLAPDLALVTPSHGWPSAHDAKRSGLATRSTEAGSFDQNLWGRAIETQERALEAHDDFYTLTRAPIDAPPEAAQIALEFDRGLPIAVNDVAMPLAELIANLETIAGAHGVGRLTILDRDGRGPLLRTACEAPAAVVLRTAHRELERLMLPHDLQRLKQPLAAAYADIVRAGAWFTPAREAIDAFVAIARDHLTGVVCLRVFRGDCRAVDVSTATREAATVST
jgi:argininosuccinate synthase